MRLSDFFTVKSVPQLFWSAPHPLMIRPPLISFLLLCIGLVIFGLGEAFMIAAGIGVSPWTVLAQGVSLYAGLSIGTSTFLISIAVLVFWIPLRQLPGIGTILNAIIIASVIDISLPHIPVSSYFLGQFILAVLGIVCVGLGSAIYLVANLGPGPRDGLMTGLQRVTGRPIMWVRSSIEIIVVLLGWSLGGVVGVGTLLFAFGVGPIISIWLFSFTVIFRRT